MTGTVLGVERMPFGALLLELGRRRPEAVVMVGDLGRYVDIEPFAEAFPDRFLQMGMSEANMIGSASGLAKTGLMPIVVTYGVFITRRAYDQVAMSLTTGPTRVALVGFMPGITTPFRATHQAIDDVALMRVLPSMAVIDPADAVDLDGALAAACIADGPTYIRGFRGVQPPLPRAAGEDFELGQAVELAREGDVAFISSGLATQWVQEAVAVLDGEDVASAHLHVPTIKPLDVDAVADFCERHRRVLCVENHSTIGGLGDAVAGVVAGYGLATRVERRGVPDAWPPSGAVAYLRGRLGLDPRGLADCSLELRKGG